MPTSILIVDDNKDAADSLAAILVMEGYAPIVTYDGQSALRAFDADAPAVVLLDFGLPDMHGAELARRLRERGGRDVLLIVITGWGHAAVRERTRDAGVNAHLVKPVEVDELLRLLRVFLSTGHCGEAAL